MYHVFLPFTISNPNAIKPLKGVNLVQTTSSSVASSTFGLLRASPWQLIEKIQSRWSVLCIARSRPTSIWSATLFLVPTHISRNATVNNDKVLWRDTALYKRIDYELAAGSLRSAVPYRGSSSQQAGETQCSNLSWNPAFRLPLCTPSHAGWGEIGPN